MGSHQRSPHPFSVGRVPAVAPDPAESGEGG
jgi:hypothetical protein